MLFVIFVVILAVHPSPVTAQSWCTFTPVTISPPAPTSASFTTGGVCCIVITIHCECSYVPGQNCDAWIEDSNGNIVWGPYSWSCIGHCIGPSYVCLWNADTYKIKSSYLCDATTVTVAPAPANTQECINCHP